MIILAASISHEKQILMVKIENRTSIFAIGSGSIKASQNTQNDSE